MTDTRTTAEKLQAEADTEQRVKSEAALAYLRGKYDAMKAEHALDKPSIIALARHEIEALKYLIDSGELPLPPTFPKSTIDMGLVLLLRALPER